MKLAEGKTYRTASGHIVGPMRYNENTDPYVWQDIRTGLSYTDEGRFLIICPGEDDIVEEYINEAA